MSFIATNEEFEECLINFFNQSQTCSSELNKWSLKTSNSFLKRSYLARETSIITDSIPTTAIEMNHSIEEADDPTVENFSLDKQVIRLEHHIVYSTSYQVPVLYFRAFNEYGTPLCVEEIYKFIIPPSFQHVALSQMEHPVLGMPFWYIHPCDTRKLMNTIQFEPLEYIKSWLSVYGPIVRCSISTDMFL